MPDSSTPKLVARLAAISLLYLAAAVAHAEDFSEHATAQGSTVLVPEGKAKTKRPALILLPFTGGSASDLYERWYADSLSRQAQKLGFIVVLPAPTGSAQNYSTGTAWTETLNRYRRDISDDAKELAARFDADPKRIALAGYSMGGDIGWALIQRDPELYAGAVVMGSRASYRDKGLDRFAKRGGRVFFFMGGNESEARKAGARAAIEAMKRAGVSHRSVSAGGDHVPAPTGLFATGVEFVLGYSDGVSSPASSGIDLPPSAPPRATSKPSQAQAQAQASQPAEPPSPCNLEGFWDPARELYGYKDPAGKIRIKQQFTEGWEFNPEGVAPVRNEDGDTGYVTCDGRFFPVLEDNGPDDFSGGLVRIVGNDQRIGYADSGGRTVIPPRYEFGTQFCDGMAAVYSGCQKYQNDGFVKVSCINSRYIDRSGREISRFPSEDCEADLTGRRHDVQGPFGMDEDGGDEDAEDDSESEDEE